MTLLYTIRNEANETLILQTECPSVFKMWVDHKMGNVKSSLAKMLDRAEYPSDLDMGKIESLRNEEKALDRLIEMDQEKRVKRSKRVAGIVINGYNVLITSAVHGS